MPEIMLLKRAGLKCNRGLSAFIVHTIEILVNLTTQVLFSMQCSE